jgi:hypothetical protein
MGKYGARFFTFLDYDGVPWNNGSGLDVTTSCRERALCRSYFFVWKKRLRESAAGKFLEVQVAEPAPSVPSDSGFEVRRQNGRSLVVGEGFDANHLRALLAVVEPGT